MKARETVATQGWTVGPSATGAAADVPREDVGVQMARAMSKVRYEDLPASVVTATKRSILDTVGVIMAASTLGGDIPSVVEVATESGGREEATIFGYGTRVPAVMAAFANGAMVHCLDYDDIYQGLALHSSGPVVPAALAMAERVGGVSGKDLIAAVAAANDFTRRFGYSTEWKGDWFSYAIMGYFGATVAAGRIFGLTSDQLFHALGIAYCQTGGTAEMRLSLGSDIAGLVAGWPSRGGVFSVLLAARGVRGIAGVFDGSCGFVNMFLGGNCKREVLLEGLGTVFAGDDISFRPWPACGAAHPSIDATLQLVRANDLHVDDIETLEVRVGHPWDWLLCEPLDVRCNPATPIDARFSLPYNIAVAALRRRVALEDFLPQELANPDVLALAMKVRPVWDPSMQEFTPGIAGSHQMTIRTRDGKAYTHRTDTPYGRHPNGMTQGDLEAKFRDCASYAAKPIGAPHIERAIEIFRDLEHCDDVARLAAALRGDS